MKKILTVFAGALSMMAVSCLSPQESVLSVELDSKNYVMEAETPLVVQLVASQSVDEDIEVPFTLSGNAVKDEDYTVDAEAFVIKQGHRIAEVTINPLNNVKKDLLIKMALTPDASYVLGEASQTEILVNPKEMMVISFDKPAVVAVGDVELKVNVLGKDSGKDFVAPMDLHIPFVVDPASSAKLGTDYSMKGDAVEFLIKKGEKSAELTLVAAAANGYRKETSVKMTLAPVPAVRFEMGINDELTVKFPGLEFKDLAGKWSFKSFPLWDKKVCDVTPLELMFADTGDSMEELPGNNTENDVLEFKVVDGKNVLVPHLTGDMKKYFRECEITGAKPVNYEFYWFPEGEKPLWACYELTLSKANNLFAEKEEIKEGKIIIALGDDGQTLNIVVTQYTPTEYYKGVYPILGELYPDYWDILYVMTKVK